MSHIEALREAISIASGQERFGAIIGRSQQAVAYYLTRPLGLPAEYVLTIEAETRVPRWRLRPDIYPIDLSASPAAGSTLLAEVA